MTFKKSFWLCHYEENLSPSIIIKAPALWTPSFIQDYVIGECSLWMNFTESKDLRNIYIFFSTIFSVPVTYILLLLCSKNHDFFAKCFPMHVISIVRFPKNIPADFVTAGTLTKLPIERSTAKQKKNCSCINHDFCCAHLPGAFSWFSENLRTKLLFLQGFNRSKS